MACSIPAFETFKASNANEVHLLDFWLKYWVCYGMLTSLEQCFYYVVVSLPFYYPLKVALFLYLFAPYTAGAICVYSWFLAPVLRRRQEEIDAVLEQFCTETKRSLVFAAKTSLTVTAEASQTGATEFKKRVTLLGPKVVRSFVASASQISSAVALTSNPRRHFEESVLLEGRDVHGTHESFST